MNRSIEASASLNKIASDTDSSLESNSLSVHDDNYNDFVSNMFNKISETNRQYSEAISSMTSIDNFDHRPEEMIQLMRNLGDNLNHSSLISVLARKSLSTVETLVKSQ